MTTDRPLTLGVTCYPTFGGSGIVATEVGLELARRGHTVHFICADVPFRFDRFVKNVFFHEVHARDYPLFDTSPYALALTSKMVEVSTWHHLDLLHVHYAIPHAASAYLARQILGPQAPALLTTLHGTDITVVGNDPSFLPVTKFSLEHSDAITVPSASLKDSTYENLGLSREVPIDVISNFVDTERYAPAPKNGARAEPSLVHNSNFRPMKRVLDVIRIFAQVNRVRPCQLVLIGDGPDRSNAERLVHELGLSERVRFLGKQLDFVEVLQGADLFLLPSQNESFGLAALEALSCGLPVIASKVGGVPEVIEDGVCGFLKEPGDVEGMARAALRLLEDRPLYERFSAAARTRAVTHFPRTALVDAYEACFRRVLETRAPALKLRRPGVSSSS